MQAGHVYHVVMYAGDGKTIEAASTKLGIIESKVNTKNAVWATRIINDNYTLAGGGISNVNATNENVRISLGNFRLHITVHVKSAVIKQTELQQQERR